MVGYAEVAGARYEERNGFDTSGRYPTRVGGRVAAMAAVAAAMMDELATERW